MCFVPVKIFWEFDKYLAVCDGGIERRMVFIGILADGDSRIFIHQAAGGIDKVDAGP